MPDPSDSDTMDISLLTDDSASTSEDGRFGVMLKALATPHGSEKREDAHLRIDQLVGGKYRLTKLIGQGGMGDVFEATGVSGEVVAVKIMSSAFERSPERKRRFEREMRAAMSIQSPHVVRVIDADGHPAEGPSFMAMERLLGSDLRAHLKEHGPLPPKDACRLFHQACQGLDAAHSLGIIHRDIKPGNLFLHQQGGEIVLKICDFGIAKKVDLLPSAGGSTSLTRQGDVVGTVIYMSPEQLKDAKNVNAGTDLWSLCASLYEALSGRKPWGNASTMGDVVIAVATWRLKPLGLVAPQLPRALTEIVDRGLLQNPALRWQSARELAAALAPFA